MFCRTSSHTALAVLRRIKHLQDLDSALRQLGSADNVALAGAVLSTSRTSDAEHVFLRSSIDGSLECLFLYLLTSI